MLVYMAQKKVDVMRVIRDGLGGIVILLLCGCHYSDGTVQQKKPSNGNRDAQQAGLAVSTPARAGAVDGTSQNSDEFIWRLFVDFVSPVSDVPGAPVVFETWASDKDIFSTNPRWPEASEPKTFQASVLRSMNLGHGGPVDVSCAPPGNAAVGGFPSSGAPVPCIAEEVRRNRPMFDYIVDNQLTTQTGLKAAYANSFKVAMPTTAVAVKGDWVPTETLLQWIPAIGSLEDLRALYYTGVSEGTEYALVSLHVSSRQNANWVWGTFEHQLSPGRCDDIGCWDTFGAVDPEVLPNRSEINSYYGNCEKTPELTALMAKAGLSAVWGNYCLKSTQVDYAAPDGTPYVLGNSTIERIVGNGTVAASSCIACHAYASFGPDGKPSAAATSMLPYNPTGAPIPAVLDGSIQFDFMWGLLLAPQ